MISSSDVPSYSFYSYSEMTMYDIVLADPPWPYHGSTTKNAAAGKHYDLMTIEDIKALPVKSLLNKKAAVFLWVTGPRMDLGVEVLKAWGLHYRGVAHVWAKTRKSDGALMGARGVPPTYSKPTTEFLLLGTTCKRGRPFKLLSSKLPQLVLAPVGRHSEKPEIFRQLVEEGYGSNLSKVELFARKQVPGWTVLGKEIDGNDIATAITGLQAPVVTRNMATSGTRAFWAAVTAAAKEVEAWPEWKKGATTTITNQT